MLDIQREPDAVPIEIARWKKEIKRQNGNTNNDSGAFAQWPSASRKRSTSIAAMQPVPAAVIAWR